MNIESFKNRCKEIRRDTLDIFFAANRGHIGSSLSVVEILTILYYSVLNVDPKRPKLATRDRFILSKGHGCISLYAILGRLGFFPKSEWSKFCQPGGILGGHPSSLKIPGVDASTGSLGQGLSIGVGMAYQAKLSKMDHRVFVLLGDGECNEGSIWEAALSASQKRLNNLIALVDYNKVQSYGNLDDVCSLHPFRDKWESFGFDVYEVSMILDPLELLDVIERINSDRPSVIICHTVKGMGIPLIEGDLSWHHKTNLSDEQKQKLQESLDNA